MDFDSHAREWLAAWNAHDLDRILALYAADVEFFSPFIVRLAGHPDGVLRGKSALRDYFARGLAAYPNLKFEFIRLYSGVRSCVLEYRSVNHLRAAETMEFDAAGKVCRVQAHYAVDDPTTT
jgi:ketosteroid isomerase-like protein